MKVEYVRSAFGLGPDMLIAGNDYKAALGRVNARVHQK